MFNFNFSEKGLGLVSPSHSMYDFSIKMFLMLHSFNWLNFIVWLSLLREILSNMCITIVCYPDCAVIKFEINLTFLSNTSFCYMTKKVKTKSWISWERKELLRSNKKHFSIIFQGLSITKNFFRPEIAPFTV